jgi:hypothetical protein
MIVPLTGRESDATTLALANLATGTVRPLTDGTHAESPAPVALLGWIEPGGAGGPS